MLAKVKTTETRVTYAFGAAVTLVTSCDPRYHAIEKRRQWMRLIGIPEEEIAEDCRNNPNADMDDEIASYNAAIQLEAMNLQIDD